MIVIIQLHAFFPDPHNIAIFTHHEKDLVMLTFLRGLGLAPCLILLMCTLDLHHFLAGCLQPSFLDCSTHCLLSNQFLSHHQSHLLKSYQGVRAQGRRRIWINLSWGLRQHLWQGGTSVFNTLSSSQGSNRVLSHHLYLLSRKGAIQHQCWGNFRKIRNPRLFSAIK